jgi:hypothetical protein
MAVSFFAPQHCTEFEFFLLLCFLFFIQPPDSSFVFSLFVLFNPPMNFLNCQVPGARVHEGTMTPYTLPDGQQKYLYKKTRIHFASLPWTDTPFPDPILPTEPPSLSLPS